MKTKALRSFIPLLLLCGPFVAVATEHSVHFEIAPRFHGAPFVFDSLTNVTATGQAISVTRLDFLLSEFVLRSIDGEWIALTNSTAFISGRNNRTSFVLSNIASGSYDQIRFRVGLPKEWNHANPAQFPPTHPLNPNVNGLHWNWQGGYVFMALEGSWLSHEAKESGYSFHLATDTQPMTVQLPVTLDLTNDLDVCMAFDVAKVFAAKHSIIISEESNSTHSRTNDVVANHLRENIEQAFAFAGNRITAGTPSRSPEVMAMIAPKATPYRFTMSALFPQPNLPADNPLTEEGVELGRRLFNEPLLSINGSQSCASCHDAAHGFSENKRFSIGAEGKAGTRNAMPLFNLAWKSSFFWDGRATALREQVLQPIQNPIEMHETLSNVVEKLSGARCPQRAADLPNVPAPERRGEDTAPYPEAFARVFGSPEITPDRIARALEQFLLTQISHDSKLDRVLNGEEKFTAEEQRGFELFHTEYDPRREQFGADCFHCHGGPLFQSAAFANNGLDSACKDLGRYSVTKRDGDQGKFAVPSLRNVELTSPYMHDGRFTTLEDVVEHYSAGVKRSSTLDPNLAKHPDGGVPLSGADKRALIAFLKTLTDQRFKPAEGLAQNERATKQ